MDAIDLFLIILICLSLGISLMLFISLKMKERDESKSDNPINVERLKILLEENSVDKINSCVDQFIENAANMYTLLKLSQDPNHYITEEMQREMSNYILASVKKNMTEDVLSLISMIYVVNSDKDIEDYLNIRIKLYILSFMVNYNQLQTDEGRI